MSQVYAKDLYPGAWGIVHSRRDEIEAGPNGTFDRIMREELEKNFFTIAKCAEALDVHESTARRLMREEGVDYIMHDGMALYQQGGVRALRVERDMRAEEAVIDRIARAKAKADKKAKKK